MEREIVIDASATGSWLFDEEASVDGDRIFKEVLQGGIQLIQPALWSYEIINMLRSAVMSKKRLKKEYGEQLFKLWTEIPVKYAEHEPYDNVDIFNCSLKNDLSAYEAVYFCLAQKKGIELITEDSHLLKLKMNNPWIKEFEG